MDSVTKANILAALRRWVNQHPRPDEPAIQFGSSAHPDGLSPREIVQEIEGETEQGRFLLQLLDNSMKTSSPETVLKGFGWTEGLLKFQAHAH